MGKSSPTPPPAPDPVAIAQAQGDSNVETAIATALLNQVNEVTPFGTTTFNQIGGPDLSGGGGGGPITFPNPKGGPDITLPGSGGDTGGFGNIPQFERVTTLNPVAQQQLEAQQLLGLDLTALAGENVGAVRTAQQGGIDFEGLPATVSGIDTGGIAGFQGSGQPIQSNLRTFDPQAAIDTSQLQNVAPQAGRGIDTASLQGVAPQGTQGINTAGLFGIRGDFAQQGSELERATFDRGFSLLEPGFGREQERAEIRLSERGLPLSSQAGGDILEDVRLSRGRQLNELALSSVQAGRQEQARLFAQAQALRGQQFGEAQSIAGFENQAAQQRFQQQFNTRGQQFGEAETTAGFDRNLSQDLFNQQFNIRGQQFGEQATAGQFANLATDQRFGQAFDASQFANTAQAQDFAQLLAGQQATNQAQLQTFNQDASNAALQNAARQQAIQEQAFLRNIPINDIAALLGTAPGIQTPQFSPVQNVGIAGTDVIGAQLGAAGIDQRNFEIQQQSRSGLLGGLFDLGSAALPLAFSDIRVKENIEHYGKLPNGLRLYKYNYINDNKRVIGVMAQEVEKVMPEAVININGIKAVNYAMVV